MGFKRLFFDIETSYMIVKGVWQLKNNDYISPDNILQYPKIICICYKWQGSDTTYYLKWDEGDDKAMCKAFFNILMDADEVVGHNGDNFDLKWVRTRFLAHGIKSCPDIKSIDTLKIARNKLKLHSNKLDEIGHYYGLGRKVKTRGMGMWDDIILRKSKKAMNEMIDYCIGDVLLLEKVFLFLEGFSKPKTHLGVFSGGSKIDCPYCASERIRYNDSSISLSGTIKPRMRCADCDKSYYVPLKVFNDWKLAKKGK